MIKVNVPVNLYDIDELTGYAKEKAISDFRMSYLSDMSPSDFISGDPEYDTPEELHNAYDAECRYLEEHDAPIIELIHANQYLFYADGEAARVEYTFENGKLYTAVIIQGVPVELEGF